MSNITWLDLSWCLIPVLLVCVIHIRWNGNADEVLYASARMLIQLIAMGYVLVSLFNHPSPWISLLIVSVMLCIAAWIAIRPIRHQPGCLMPALAALGISVGIHLSMCLLLILKADNWYQPELLIPLAGMFFANSMNAISLSAERFFSEKQNGIAINQAKLNGFNAAMIPQINGLLAVGLVALPGMMTGQILSGVSPLVAVKYQIMIMTMILGTTGLGSAIMLTLLARKETPQINI
jgi:putative ABC transport system permease protein